MAGVLLAVFPLVLLFAPRLAWLAVAVAILLLVGKRLSTARAVAHRRVDRDAAI
jgi:hypothetical protein